MNKYVLGINGSKTKRTRAKQNVTFGPDLVLEIRNVGKCSTTDPSADDTHTVNTPLPPELCADVDEFGWRRRSYWEACAGSQPSLL